MFENKTEQQAREEILTAVKQRQKQGKRYLQR